MPEMQTLTVNGVKYDIRDANAAPAGYGIGETIARHLDDFNALVPAGLYYYDMSTANRPDVNGFFGTVIIDRGDGGDISQFVMSEAYNLLVRYNLGEWSWVNPSHVEGREYLTTERTDLDKVYCNTFMLMGANGASTPLTSAKQVVRIEAYSTTHGVLPVYSSSGAAGLAVTVKNNNLTVSATSAYSNVSDEIWVTVYYTKT